MMNYCNKIVSIVLLCCSCMLFNAELSAQCIEDPPGSGNFIDVNGGPCVNTIITAVPFLRITPDARSGAMGDVGLGISADANSIHLNASKLAFAEEDAGISATYTPWLRALGLTDVYLAYLAGYTKLDDLEAIGGSIRYFSLGSIDFTDEQGQSLGQGKPNEFEIAAAYARQFSPKFSAALTLKYIYSNLAAGQQLEGTTIEAGNAFAGDLSFTYRTPIKLNEYKTNLTVAAAISNIGTKITYTRSVNKDFIPANFGLGAAWDLDFDEFNRFTFAFDLNKLLVPTPCIGDAAECDIDADGVRDHKQQSVISAIFGSFGDAPGGGAEELRELTYSIGMEYWYDKQFAVRAGYYTEDATKGNRQYLTLGLGIKYNIFGLNFSYLVPTGNAQRSPLDNTLRFSLLFDFGAFEIEDEEL